MKMRSTEVIFNFTPLDVQEFLASDKWGGLIFKEYGGSYGNSKTSNHRDAGDLITRSQC